MAEPTTPSQDIQAPGNGHKPQPTRSSRQRARTITCGICGRHYVSLTRKHLAKHGLTPAQYGRVYGATTPAQATQPHTRPQDASLAPLDTHSGVPLHTVQQLADACAESPEFLSKLATDVGAHLLGGHTRGLLAASLGAVIATRLKQAGSAAARLQEVNTELAQSWRLEQGGENGGPTPTRDVLLMQQAAASELDRASEAILRAGKLAIDERRGQSGEALGDAPLDRYTGARDAIALPDDVGPGERAIMLALLERMAGRVLRERSIVDVKQDAESITTPDGDTPLSS